jgi:hypothetical protein
MQINIHGVRLADHRHVDEFAVTHLTDDKGNYITIYFESADELRQFWHDVNDTQFSNPRGGTNP